MARGASHQVRWLRCRLALAAKPCWSTVRGLVSRPCVFPSSYACNFLSTGPGDPLCPFVSWQPGFTHRSSRLLAACFCFHLYFSFLLAFPCQTFAIFYPTCQIALALGCISCPRFRSKKWDASYSRWCITVTLVSRKRQNDARGDPPSRLGPSASVGTTTCPVPGMRIQVCSVHRCPSRVWPFQNCQSGWH